MPTYTVSRPSWYSSKEELREGDRIIGVMTMLNKWTYAKAEAKMPHKIVHFGYTGWTAQKLFIRDTDGNDIADVKSHSFWGYKVSVTIDGKTYQWRQKKWWSMTCGWYTEDNREIMELYCKWWGKVEITTPQEPNENEMLLIFFGMYLTDLWKMAASASSGM